MTISAPFSGRYWSFWLKPIPSLCGQRAPMGCQNFLLPFLVTAKMRCVGRALVVWVVMVLSFRLRARPHGGLDARFKAEAEKRGCHKRAEGPPEGAELHKHRAEASGFDGNARLGRNGRKERTPCHVTPKGQ